MNPEAGADVELSNEEETTENNEFGEGTGSLTNNFLTAAANNANADTAKNGLLFTQV